MSAAPILRISEGDHFWKQAVIITLFMYGIVFGLGFLRPSEPFVIKTSAFEGDATDVLSDQSSSVEVDLVSAPAQTAAAIPSTPPPIEISAEPPTTPPIQEPVSTPPAAPPTPVPVPETTKLPIPTPPSPTPPPHKDVVPRKSPVPPLVKAPAPPSTQAPTSGVPSAGPNSTGANTANTAASRGSSGGTTTSGNITLGSRDFPNPPYPPAAVQRRFQGTVVVNISVKDGAILHVTVATSSGYTRLDIHAFRWIKARWVFPKQLTRNFNQRINFKLEN
jgi:TonB family protein